MIWFKACGIATITILFGIGIILPEVAHIAANGPGFATYFFSIIFGVPFCILVAWLWKKVLEA